MKEFIDVSYSNCAILFVFFSLLNLAHSTPQIISDLRVDSVLKLVGSVVKFELRKLIPWTPYTIFFFFNRDASGHLEAYVKAVFTSGHPAFGSLKISCPGGFPIDSP